MPFLAPYVGSIATNLGTGYVYQLARNEDGSRSKGINEYIDSLDPDILHGKVVAMYDQLIEHRGVVNDLGLANIFVREHLSNDYDLCLVDGFGNSDFIKLADYSLAFMIKKLNRKFTSLCNKLDIPTDFLR